MDTGSVPQWLKKRVYLSEDFSEIKKMLADFSVNTVCASAGCPNITECFAAKFATFMILGDACTRHCAFCSVKKGDTMPPDPTEPDRVIDCAIRLGLKHVIVTSVTRDDLPDGGAGHFVKLACDFKKKTKSAVLELLIPDFNGNMDSIEAVASSPADIVGHNIETAKRLYPVVRKGAVYSRSLKVLKSLKKIRPGLVTKSAILAGMGEFQEEIVQTMGDLRDAGCDVLAIGQYLRPSEKQHPVDRFVTPEEFESLKRRGIDIGFKDVSAGPFIRSSYMEGRHGKHHTANIG